MGGNIVGDMFIYCGEKIPLNRFAQLFYEGGPLEEKYLNNIREESIRHRLLLYELEPTYGCRITALCEVIECKRY